MGANKTLLMKRRLERNKGRTDLFPTGSAIKPIIKSGTMPREDTGGEQNSKSI
ncbi:unnamed protein product, partial [Sphagnum balticum]